MARQLRRYRVVWEIEIDAVGALEAAKEARVIQQDPDSIATVYDVIDTEDAPVVRTYQVDLQDETVNDPPVQKIARGPAS